MTQNVPNDGKRKPGQTIDEYLATLDELGRRKLALALIRAGDSSRVANDVTAKDLPELDMAAVSGQLHNFDLSDPEIAGELIKLMVEEQNVSPKIPPTEVTSQLNETSFPHDSAPLQGPQLS